MISRIFLSRTSPFTFTGNKFEFRMVGSSASVAGPNIILNTVVAETLDEFATRLEKSKDVNAEITSILKDTLKAHGKIIFNGNNYSEEWVKEAEKRGLPNVKNTVDAHKAFTTQKSKDVFAKYGVLSNEELHSRYEIYIEQYAKCINIEAMTALKMLKTLYIPVIIGFTDSLAGTVAKVKAAGSSSDVQSGLLKMVTTLLESIVTKTMKLETNTVKAQETNDTVKKAETYRDNVFTALAEVRKDVDAAEKIMPAGLWPVPTYADMLFKL